MKKLIVSLLVLGCVVSLMGCSKTTVKTSREKESSQSTVTPSKEESKEEKGVKMNEAGVFPIVDEKMKLTAFIDIQNPNNDDFENNEFTTWLEEKTNIDIEFQVVNSQDKSQKLSVMMASGEYPDILFNTEFTAEQQTLYGTQGILLPLNDYIDSYGVETKKVFDRYKEVKKIYTMDDGNIYALPKIDDGFHVSVCGKMWVYEPWLEKLDMPMPTNTEEYYELLKAIKNTDLNGNGVHDEIALTGSTHKKAWNGDPAIFLMNSFIYYNPDQQRLRTVDGKVQAVYSQPEFREGLRYIKKLYDEELFTSEIYTQDRDQLKAIGENPDAHLIGTVPGGYAGVFMNTGKKDGRWLNFRAIPPLEGPSGYKKAYYRPLTGSASFSITNKCENPEIAFRLADAIYDPDTSLRSIYGIPGEGQKWEYAKEGLSVNGEKAHWIYNKSTDLKNFAWSQTANACRTRDLRLSKYVENRDKDLEVILYNGSIPYDEVKPSEDELVYGLIFDAESVSEVTDLATSLKIYVDDMMIRFITGSMDIENDWDSYLAELENIGLERYIQYQQQAYDRKLKK